MNAAAGRLAGAILGAVVLLAVATGIALAIAAPRFLLIEDQLAIRVLVHGAVIGSFELALLCSMTWVRMHRHRFTLRALGLGSHTLESDALISLAREPGAITFRSIFIALSGSLLTLIPPFRPEGLELDTAISLFLLALCFSTTAGMALYVIVRRRISQAILLAPEDAM
ncbi:MAG: hypothetical protein CSA75_05115, partial [Sorangium cellulosum]